MAEGIYIAMTGARAQSDNLDVVANNVANTSTTGYKAERLSFTEVMGRSPGMAFVAPGNSKADNQPGALRNTGNPLDLALRGDGFFAVETAQGTRFTRAGDFRANDEGILVNGLGMAVRGRNGGAIAVPPWAQNVIVDPSGTVNVDETPIGQIDIVRLDQNTMQRMGANLFNGQVIGQSDANDVEVVSGVLEQANFDPVRGMVDLVRISRGYESMTRMIESYKAIENRTARGFRG